MILSIAYFQIQWTIFFSIFKKSSKKKGHQLDSNSRSACYKADALTIGHKASIQEVVKIVSYNLK